MTQNEYDLDRARIEVRQQEAKVREARSALDTGSRKAKAEYEEVVQKLRTVVERESLTLERDKAWVALCETKIAEPFKNTD